jgi:hypothetical protein
MTQETHYPGSRLFTLRLWQEELGNGQAEWRGRAQDIGTGSSAYFRDWPGLVAVLSRLLETTDTPTADPLELSPASPDPQP